MIRSRFISAVLAAANVSLGAALLGDTAGWTLALPGQGMRSTEQPALLSGNTAPQGSFAPANSERRV
jgi:hypothetical protein